MNILSEVIASLHSLPSPRGVALELMRLAQREDASVSDVTKIVRADPALVGRLIHAANCMNGGHGARTGMLHEAVLRIGFSAARQIALGFSLVNDYRSGHCAAFDYGNFWMESLQRGVSAQAIASRVGGLDPGDAFVCGLLADIGRIALATAQPRAYADLITRVGGNGTRLRQAERERFGTDHADLGAALLERWSFPDHLVRTVRAFHTRNDDADTVGDAALPLTRMMVLAEALAKSFTANAPPAWMQVALEVAAHLGIDAAALNAITTDMMDEMLDWAPLLDMPIPATTDASDYREYASPGPNAAGMEQPLNILLVDDSEDDRDLTRYTLERAGHRVQTVASGEDALAAIASGLPHMVITDWEMPGMDGIALCRALRATRLGRNLYVIMHTGYGKESDLIAGIEAGADDFVVKSATAYTLLARVAAGAGRLQRTGDIADEFNGARLLAVELAAGAGQLDKALRSDYYFGG